MNPNNMGPRVWAALRVRPPVVFEDIYVDVIHGHFSPDLIRVGHVATNFNVDHLFGCKSSQDVIFDIAAKPRIDKFLEGEENVTFVAYGNKMTGKSFTIFGKGFGFVDTQFIDTDSYGIFPRLAEYIFSRYDASVFVGENPLVKVQVAFVGVITSVSIIENLLNSTESTTGQKTEDFLRNLEYVQCRNASDMINCMSRALFKCGYKAYHVVGRVVIDQPIFQRDGKIKHVKTSALFVDITFTGAEYPGIVSLQDHTPTRVFEDCHILNTLAFTWGGTINSEIFTPDNNHLFNILKSSFNGERATTVFCCIAPGFGYYPVTSNYLINLITIKDIRNNYQAFSRFKNEQGSNNANALISEAESLLSRLSVSKSISDEDQEKLKNWLHMKKECEEESTNAQSHGQLECIEEVTESEEEIASSDEKMSESSVSLDNSLSESDQEEGDSKVYQVSDDNFFSSLDNMCVQFNTFVDKFVDSFKAKTSLSPAKEHKRDYSATRRGGLPHQPDKVGYGEFDTLKTRLDSLELQLSQNVNQKSQPSDGSSQGCIKKVVPDRETKVTHSLKSRSARSAKAKDRRADKTIYYSDAESSSADEREKTARQKKSEDLGALHKEKAVKSHEDDKYVTWSMVEPPIHSDYDIYSELKRQEEELREIRSSWASWINQIMSAKMKGKEGEAKALEVQRNSQMFHAVGGIDSFITLMKKTLELDSDQFKHFIRWHRFAREDFCEHKNRLDNSIKNETATNEELRDHLMADEMIETLDSCIEFLNYMIQNNKPVEQKLPNTKVGKDVLDGFKSLTALEMRNLVFKYFFKVVDLRENSKHMEATIANQDKLIEVARSKIMTLIHEVQRLRGELSQQQPVATYSPSEAACNRQSPPPTLALPEGSKSKRGPSIPQQNLSKLQVTKPAPSAKVTLTNKKLIIEQASSQNKQ